MLFDQYAASKIGPSDNFNYSGGSFTRYDILADLLNDLEPSTVSPFRNLPVPLLFVIRASTEVILRQTQRGQLTSDSEGFRLLPNVYWPLLVEGPQDSLLLVRDVASGAGTLRITLVSSIRPANVASNSTLP